MSKLEGKPTHKVSRALADFEEFARRSINPNLADAAAEEMLIQHSKHFDND